MQTTMSSNEPIDDFSDLRVEYGTAEYQGAKLMVLTFHVGHLRIAVPLDQESATSFMMDMQKAMLITWAGTEATQ